MSAQPLGWCPASGQVRLVAPTAERVDLIERQHPGREPERVTPMAHTPRPEGGHCWVATVDAPLGYYRFRVTISAGVFEVADPWSRAVTRQKKPASLVWSVATAPSPKADAGVRLSPDSVSLLELHIADQTSHPSAKSRAPGSFRAFAQSRGDVGLGGVVGMGFDAVELLPVHTWPVFEGERLNHWGYMPSFYLAFSHRYCEHWRDAGPDDWLGVAADGAFSDPFEELRDLVRACHQRGVGVVLDVVWNHICADPMNPLRALDPGGWLARDSAGALANRSGCGNDVNSRDPFMRSLLVAAIRRLFVELGVDGVRLDLAEILDDETLVALRNEALSVRSDALLIAEPWSMGGYRPQRLAELGWVVWSDKYREQLRGAILPHSGTSADGLSRWLQGGGQLSHGVRLRHRHTVSYVESHDGHTVGDLYRRAVGATSPALSAIEREGFDRAMACAWALMAVTRGPVMAHQGFSVGRSKWCGRSGFIRDSYDRDDEVNWIDWDFGEPTQSVRAQAASWLAARRRWLRPLFEALRTPHQLVGQGAAGLIYLVDAAVQLAEGDQDVEALCVLWSLPAAGGGLPLPPGRWRVVQALGEVAVNGEPRSPQAQLGAGAVAIAARFARPRSANDEDLIDN